MTYLMTLSDPLKAPLSHLGPLNMPLDPIGPLRSTPVAIQPYLVKDWKKEKLDVFGLEVGKAGSRMGSK